MDDLHIHLGGAVPSSVLWEILCDNGLQTEYASFDAFHDSLTAIEGEVSSLDDFLGRYFSVTEEIQSSPAAASVSAYQVVAKAYRRARVETLELRFNPLKRVRHGLHTLDAIILAVMQGLERASLHYGVTTGIILSMGRDLTLDENEEIVEAAIAWRSRGSLQGANGVVGLDIAGSESAGLELEPAWMKRMAALMWRAREAGLGITYHIGESPGSGPEGLLAVLESVQPDRIGHGIELRRATGAVRERILEHLRRGQVCLELCPSVNLVTRVVEDIVETAGVARTLVAEGIPWCVNTDNPYLIHTNLRREHELIGAELGPDADEFLALAREHARAHRFVE